MITSSPTHTEAAKTEQIITEFFAKSLHIILESRALSASSRNFSTLSSPSSTSSSSSSSVRPRDKWFNLALRECPTALENADLWRHNNLHPIVVDIVLVHRTMQLELKERNPFEELGFGGSQSEKIVERWVIQYESRKTRDCSNSSSSSSSRRSSNSFLQNLYKKATLLIRSLYATVKNLPAYKIFKELNSSASVCAFTLAHRVSTFFEPFTSKQESEMLKFVFTPVDTLSGRLCLSVLYCQCLSDVSSESSSTPLSPRVITDYVGSPMTERLMRFPSLPVVPVRMPSHGSPSSLPFSRRHSWSYENCRGSLPSANYYSPSPTHSESNTLVSNASYHCYPPPSSLPPHPSEMALLHKKNVNFDDYYPSPNFSPSPSPSPSSPIYHLGSLASKILLRSESAPVNIPDAEVANSPGHMSGHNLPPSTPIRISRCTSETERSRNLMQLCTPAEKMCPPRKDESQKYSGVKNVPNSSPQISFSRSSSRSYQDDFDDTDFICPFDVDDDDTTDPGSRAESFDHGDLAQLLEAGRFLPIRKSQGAAVGALVSMLKKAAPLHQDFSATCDNTSTRKSNNVQEPNQIPNIPSPVSIMSSGNRKTTNDALEEFHSYREMKNMLLKPHGSSK
ncbi:autophagy-related protein 13b-like [Vicia villosa]|uniref:autophagy-related protein 13b-like n=1 Tax=Vicia villosa TaxID=3911 RepID=UPI00273BC708|nr:autophagy-related protein 13b-like [Vicia villosa]